MSEKQIKTGYDIIGVADEGIPKAIIKRRLSRR